MKPIILFTEGMCLFIKHILKENIEDFSDSFFKCELINEHMTNYRGELLNVSPVIIKKQLNRLGQAEREEFISINNAFMSICDIPLTDVFFSTIRQSIKDDVIRCEERKTFIRHVDGVVCSVIVVENNTLPDLTAIIDRKLSNRLLSYHLKKV